ncbi:MAG: DUF4154 domain-containing protein [Bacteroidales bacterium]|nr:DUF4154 domain-containing protein [Bacteroidales bacterium]
MKKQTFILFAIIIFISFKSFSQIKPAQLKANWIFIIGENVTFPDNNQIDTIRIAVYGRNTEVYPFVKQLAATKNIQNHFVYTEEVQRISQLTNFNIVYVDETKNDYVDAVYDKVKGTGSLIITYQSDDQEHFMINLLLQGVAEQFQIQSSNLYEANITANDKLLSLGGTKIDLQGLFDKKVEELELKEQELLQKEIQLQNKEQELQALQEEIELQLQQNQQQEQLIQQQTQELEIEKNNATKLLEQVVIQEQVLKKNQFILTNLNTEIAEKQRLIQLQNDSLALKKSEIEIKQIELETQQIEIDSQQARIDQQKAVLNVKNTQIKTQKGIIAVTVIFVVIFLFLSIIIWRSYKQNQKINKELKNKNFEIEKQKDELQNQAIQLEEFNHELAKLSLVASKTDNSVVIMDNNGVFEWVNSGFTRIYGYTLQLLRNEKGDNLIDISNDKQQKQKLLSDCQKTKKTVIYQSQNTTRSGENIWVQTALTPVIDENDDVVKLIAIESDITKLKQQETEITQKNEELHMQKAELQAQKDLLEEVNEQIRDSINYALTIQKAILPLDADISKHFATFLIYLPRDIVSGDFYWYSNPKENRYFMAAIDCTGHGVPGAFMSLISSRMLDEIVNVQHICEPKDILYNLNKMIVISLSQESTNNKDGMDMSLVRIDKQKNTSIVTFGGAKRPLIYYKRNSNQIEQIKGSRRSVGGIQAMVSVFDYEQTEIEFNTNDLIYLSTDGMIDQNNHERKRYGTPQFIRVLENVKELPLPQQKIKILEDFNSYKKDEHQRDDITVWGIKL